MRKPNRATALMIMQFEGLRLKPYLCSAGRPTIGYGSTYYENYRKVTMDDAAITKDQAESMFLKALANFSFHVEQAITSDVTDNQFGALVSLAYNIGPTRFKSSTLVKRVNADPNDPRIRDEFMKYCKVRKDGILVENEGLKKRRKKEADMYYNI